MILQRNILPDGRDWQLYYRVTGEARSQGEKLWIAPETEVSSDTYMNGFDIGAWKKYTVISDVFLNITIGGKGSLTLIRETAKGKKERIGRLDFKTGEAGETGEAEKEQYQLPVPADCTEGILYFELAAEGQTVLYAAEYGTADMPVPEIRLSVVICTYRRRQQLEELLAVLKQTEGMKVGRQPGAGSRCGAGNESGTVGPWLRVRVVDNASELEDSYGRGIEVYHNPNTGGSGGFARGMEETVRGLSEFPVTHVLLMDDDVSLQKESIHRLYALLSCLKSEYQQEVVAGRMFRQDQPKVQYTAAEIWNGGNLRHIGWNRDMEVRDNLWSMNDNSGGEYGGWWFACFPIEFVKNNRPLPFFLHCDDVEYGLRHGGTPIILNGIQVWHETYEYRQSPAILYYDTRNSLIVNAIYGRLPQKEQILEEWKQKISACHVKGDYLSERMLIWGFLDFTRGSTYFAGLNTEKKNRKLRKKKNCKRTGGSILWRIAQRQFERKYEEIIKTYEKYGQKNGIQGERNYVKATKSDLAVNG